MNFQPSSKYTQYTTATTPNGSVFTLPEEKQPVYETPPYEPEEIQLPTEVFVRELVEMILLMILIFWLINSLIGRYRIDGSSMNPTLADGEYLIINNFSYYLDEPQRGDVIVFRHPNNELNLIKRVVGIPGDHVEIVNQHVIVDGVTLTEPYIQAEPTYTGSWTVPEGTYFVLGDNRNNSSDSHLWSFLPKENILGKAELVYWPPSEWLIVPHYPHHVEEGGS